LFNLLGAPTTEEANNFNLMLMANASSPSLSLVSGEGAG
jgi:hypothetical protein